MPAPVEIRRLTAADARDYRNIRLAALETEPDAFGSVHAIEAARPVGHFAERLASSLVLGAYVEDRIVAMIGLRPGSGAKDAHKGFVWGFYVEPAWRRQGVGKALISALLAAAGGIVEQLTLAVVRDNRAAIALYERQGFQAYGIEPKALKTPQGYADEVLMVRFLHSNPGPASAQPGP